MRNRTKAMQNLVQKLYERAYEEQLNKRQQNRKLQIGSSSRSERIRTYNLIQDRITDHRLGENFQGVERFLNATSLPTMLENLYLEHKTELLYEFLKTVNKTSR